MATVSLNDIKVRLLQLKGLGYDKLLKRDQLMAELETINNELGQIDGEVTNITEMIIDAQQKAEEQTDDTSKEAEETSTEEIPTVSDETSTVPPSHVQVDQDQLRNILSPTSKSKSADKTKTPKVKKTSHSIGRRS